MTNRAGILVAVGATVAGLVSAAPAPVSAAPSSAGAGVNAPPAQQLTWTGCATEDYPALQCATVRAPLDHDRPSGRQVTLALSRIPHTAKTSQGPLLVNPGGPGGSGLSMAGFVASALPAKVAASYDVIGFDPRGVGRSTPALDCVPGHFDPVRPGSVPASFRDERAGRDRAAAFAGACGEKHGDLLPHMDTVSAAKDLDVIRRALGSRQINYFGYSYGTYLGAVYAKLYPERVRRLVLDSVVDPSGVWYDDNLAQDYAFDARHKAFAAWVAKNDAAYGLGTDPARVEAAWYAMRAAVGEHPAGGRVGPGELEDTFLPGGYYNGYWPYLAEAFAAYVNEGDQEALAETYETFGAADAGSDNGYSVYTAVQCRDAAWPRDWSTWRDDSRAAHAKAPFMTWNNTWYNAPCASWPVKPLDPVRVSNDRLPPALLFQATEDAATPYEGGVTMHRALKGSSLVVERGGGNHGITLSGSDCLDAYLADYLATGAVPRGEGGRAGVDAVCSALPDPTPLPAEKAAAQSTNGSKGSRLHGLLGFRS
ncbi:alpha/beta hydrolase [Streptomyces sp. NBC_00654]|uniref:alpha/beta hydrolase n=1 Tax=Streptomyces sp. NBC_00654 TaxID=2975799 RepID=UPI002255307B|nr:alpha/beta hydrolase [Streptomyces sp. NBC_00654]MCX4965793.1 alpha/beta hydrolase [Streptomyces sp. NBC_00654]